MRRHIAALRERRAIHFLFFLLTSASFASGQTPTHLSEEQIKAAISGDRGGFVYLNDIVSSNYCKAQKRGVQMYTPAGLLWRLNASSKKQFLPFKPTELDTLDALTIIGEGCARGTLSGPVCESITRMALLSDEHGTTVVEAVRSGSTSDVWQNGFGATSACKSLTGKFAMDDVKKVQNAKGEFFIAMFDNSKLVKIFEVKEKHLKLLGL